MQNLHSKIELRNAHSSLRTWPSLRQSRFICRAKRGRPRKTDAAEERPQQTDEPDQVVARRRGRSKQLNVDQETTQNVVAAGPARPVLPDMLQQDQQQPHHDRVISYELDITSSVELDYTDDATIIVPSYTHQAQGHDSNTSPPLDTTTAFLPDLEAAGFVGEEALAEMQQQLDAAEAAAAPAAASPMNLQAAVAAAQQQQQWPLPASRKAAGLGVLLPTQGTEGEQLVQQQGEEEEEELFPGGEEPPGLFDYEAGLSQAVTQPEPAVQLQYMPEEFKPHSRREAEYLIKWTNWVGNMERQAKKFNYEEQARYFMCTQNKESHNHYLTAKAMAIVTAEIEIEDHETGNRWDSFYPVWARAEHRWYPTGRFAAYNKYVGENIDELTVKPPPGADQEEDFDIMDDVFLMADDPGALGLDGPAAAAAAAAAGEGEQALTGPAGGLDLDNFLAGVLPGAASSELGSSYLEDVLAPEQDELLEDDLDE